MVKIPKKKTMRQLMEEPQALDEATRPRLTLEAIGCTAYPGNPSALPSAALSELFAEYTAQMSYLTEMAASARVQQQELKLLLREARARAVMSARGIKLQKWAAMYRDPEAREKARELLAVEQELLEINALIWIMKDYLRALEYERELRLQARKTGEDY